MIKGIQMSANRIDRFTGMRWLGYVVSTAVLVLVTAPGASAATETFGPSLTGAQISGFDAFSGHAVSEEEEAWYAGTAPLVGSAAPSAPISGSISRVQLEYSSAEPMEVEVWTAKGANEEWAMDHLVGAMELPSTGMNLKTMTPSPQTATLEPSNAQITQGEILAVVNSDPSAHIYPYLESSEGCVGNFEKTAPQPGSVPKYRSTRASRPGHARITCPVCSLTEPSPTNPLAPPRAGAPQGPAAPATRQAPN